MGQILCQENTLHSLLYNSKVEVLLIACIS